MRIDKYQQRVGTSLASAHTRANLQGSPIARNVRDEQFIPTTTANQVAQAGVTKANSIYRATESISKAVTNVGKVVKQIDDAEAQAQYNKGVALYQKNAADVRASQLSRDAIEEDGLGGTFKPSTTFEEDYDTNVNGFMEAMLANGLDHPGAISALENSAVRIDGQHRADIRTHAEELRIDMAIADVHQTAAIAQSKGEITKAYTDGANQGLFAFKDLEQLIKPAVYEMNMGKMANRINTLSTMGTNTFVDQDLIFSNSDKILADTNALWAAGDLDAAKVAQIERGLAGVETAVMEERVTQQKFSTIELLKDMNNLAVTGQSAEGIRQLVLAPGAMEHYGYATIVSTLKATEAMASGGAPDYAVVQQGMALKVQVRRGTVSAEEAEAWANEGDNPAKLASQYGGMITGFYATELAQETEEMQRGMGIAALLFSSETQRVDAQGNPTWTLPALMSSWEARANMYMDGRDLDEDGRTVSVWMVNEFVNDFTTGESLDDLSDWIPLNTPVMQIDINTVKDKKQADYDLHDAAFTASQGNEWPAYRDEYMDGMNLNEWNDKANQAIGLLKNFQKMIRVPGIGAMIDNKAAVGIDE
jgi:hypothetical protein